MSHDHSAVLLGAADSQIASGRGAHDMMHDAGSQGREAMREATQAMKTTSLDLELPTVEGTASSPHILEAPLPHPQDSSLDVLATENHHQPCVTTTTAHDTTKDVVGAANGIHEPDRGKTPNESLEYTPNWIEYILVQRHTDINLP